MVFLGSYLLMKALGAFALGELVSYLGASDAAIEVIVADNEMTLQSFSLFGALWATFKIQQKGSFLQFLRSLWPRVPFTPDVASWIMSASVFKGFLVSSCLVAMSLFLGFVKVEWPHWDMAQLWVFAPTFIGQVFGLALWLFLFDRSLIFMWKLLVLRGSRPLETRLVLVALGAYQLFRILNGSPHLFDQFFTVLVSALAAGAYLLWFESSQLVHGNRDRAMLVRLFSVMGFLTSLVHVYGQVLGGGTRTMSVVTVFQGPISEPTGSLANAGIVGQSLLVLFLVVAVNFLLQRVLRRSPQIF